MLGAVMRRALLRELMMMRMVVAVMRVGKGVTGRRRMVAQVVMLWMVVVMMMAVMGRG